MIKYFQSIGNYKGRCMSRNRFLKDHITVNAFLLGFFRLKIYKRLRRHVCVSYFLITLRYLAKDDFYSEVSVYHGVSRSSAPRIVHAVMQAINKKLNTIW